MIPSFLRWLVLIISFVVCAGCDPANDRFEKADSARAGGEHAHAADLYEKLCLDYPKSNACKKARDLLPATQANGATQLLQREQYRAAKQMAEKAAVGTGAPAERARSLLKDENLTMGARFEEALELDGKDALASIEIVAASKAKAAKPAAAWLEKNRPTVLITLARESCKAKPPKDDCGALSDKLVKLHPKSKEAKEAATLSTSFAKSPFDEANALEQKGKLIEAAARFDDVCKRSPPTAEPCKSAMQRADGARMRAAMASVTAMKFAEAKGIYEVIATTSSIDANKKQAQTQIDSDGMKSGLVLEEAKTLEATDKRAALPKMEEAAKSTSTAGWAARSWLGKERPQLYLEDTQTACSLPVGKNDDCPVKAKALLAAHPGTPQATEARKLLTAWEIEPIAAAEKLLKDGNVLGAATEYDRVCTRSPDSASCQKAAPLAIDTRMRGAQEAASIGHFIEAKKAFEAVSLATKDEAKRATIKKTMESQPFIDGLAKETRTASMVSARTACTEGRVDCGLLINDLVKNGATSAEANELRSLNARGKTDSASAATKVDALLAECKALSSPDLQAQCYPSTFAKWSETGAPEDSAIDRVALATAYATGAEGVPSPNKARWGLLVLGAVIGAAFGLCIQLLRRRHVPLAVLVLTSTFTLVMLALFTTHAFDRVIAGYASVGIVE